VLNNSVFQFELLVDVESIIKVSISASSVLLFLYLRIVKGFKRIFNLAVNVVSSLYFVHQTTTPTALWSALRRSLRSLSFNSSVSTFEYLHCKYSIRSIPKSYSDPIVRAYEVDRRRLASFLRLPESLSRFLEYDHSVL
jgi:hypothetical protein